MAIEPREAAMHFESRVAGLSKTADGSWTVRLKLHPQEVPVGLTDINIGQRVMVALVQLGDDEQPQVNEKAQDADRAVRSAAMLCKDPVFQKWFLEKCEDFEDIEYPFDAQDDEEATAALLRQYLGVKSRSDLKNNPRALETFKVLRQEFAKKGR